MKWEEYIKAKLFDAITNNEDLNEKIPGFNEAMQRVYSELMLYTYPPDEKQS